MSGMRCSVFIAISLDGFIARPDGALDWLPGSDPDEVQDWADGAAAEEDGHGYFRFVATCDVMVMGRATYDTVLGFGVGWPYTLPVVVLTNRPIDVVPDGADVRPMAGDVTEVVEALAADGFTSAYVDGGQVIQQLLAADLVDAMTITVVPVLLGDGIRLFGALPEDRRFVPDEPVLLGGALVQTTWRRER